MEDIPINSFKFVGMEVHVYQHDSNPSDEEALTHHYFDGYTEIQLLFTKEHELINPWEYRILIVRPVNGMPYFAHEDRSFVYATAPFETYAGFSHKVNPTARVDQITGLDIFTIRTKTRDDRERTETILIRHGKGILIPEDMICQ